MRGPNKQKNNGKLLQLEARKNHDTFNNLKNIKCPTFIAGGLFDGIAPKDNIDILNTLIMNSKKKFYKGGHAFFLEDPQAWEDIINFFKD